jgi:hypothetical protein
MIWGALPPPSGVNFMIVKNIFAEEIGEKICDLDPAYLYLCRNKLS